MKTILLPFCDDEVSQNAFELATRLARAHDGYVEGLFLGPMPTMIDVDTEGLNRSHLAQLDEESRNMAARSRHRFSECAAAQGLSVESLGDASGAKLGWHETDGATAQYVGSHGRLFDLIAVGRDFGRDWVDWKQVVEAALFDSGRPVLLVPPRPRSTFGERVVIAWNASTETARTVALAKPLLRDARSVCVVSVEGWGTLDPSGEELANYLRRSGMPATARHVKPNGRSPGEALLDECARQDADLLLKGAYTQSRLRQLIFGGATRHILANATLPVLWAH